MGVRVVDPMLVDALLSNPQTYFAVLLDGLSVLKNPYRRDQGRRPSRSKALQRWSRERAWVLSATDEGPFNFETCCYMCGINPSAVRAKLRQYGLLGETPPIRRAA